MADYPMKNPEPAPVLREAADWFERVHAESVSEDELAAWQHWLTASAAHRRAFAEVERFWNASGGIAEPPWPTYGELHADEYDGSVPVARWREMKEGQGAAKVPVRRWGWNIRSIVMALLGGLGALAVLLILFRLFATTPQIVVYETPAGVHREMCSMTARRLCWEPEQSCMSSTASDCATSFSRRAKSTFVSAAKRSGRSSYAPAGGPSPRWALHSTSRVSPAES
ncbi:MAG: FecR/PupR family sigma factor regulator [Gammaproteobacteria bacterium]|nr:FecR/PupR family sigma factor regulator [Gammaproteobacteria bacterium]